MRLLVLALALAASAAPAMAAGTGFPYSTFGAELEAEGSWDQTIEIRPEPKFFDKIELAGGMTISLDRTSLFDLSTAFGNGVQTYQYVGYTHSWLCYTDAGRRVWYIADLTYETTEDVNVGNIIDEASDPATDDLFRCLPEPRAMPIKQALLPTIGATRAELETRFSASIPPGSTRISGMSDAAAEGSGIYDMKIITYRLTNDVVDAVSIAEDYMDEDAE